MEEWIKVSDFVKETGKSRAIIISHYETKEVFVGKQKLLMTNRKEKEFIDNRGKSKSEAKLRACRENGKKGGGAFKGHHHTEEAKRKIAEAHKGKPSWNKGTLCSEEARRKIAESKKGKCWYTDGIKSKLYEEGTQPVGWKLGRIQTSERKKRKPLTEEQKRKISEATKKAMANMTEEKKNEMNSNRNAAMAKLLETEEYHQHLRKGAKKSLTPEKIERLRQNGKTAFLGKHHSEESKMKMSRKLKGKQSWLGKHHTIETIEKMKNRVVSEKSRMKMSESHIKALADGKYKSLYEIDGLKFDSSWEAIFYLFCREGKNKIERGVVLPLSNERKYVCDFKINEKLYEIKSLHFFDEDGNLYIPYGNKKPTPEKEEAFDKYDITVITDIEPYKKWCDNYFCPGFVDLFKVDLEFPYDKPIYHCFKKGKKSPYDAWFDMPLRQKAIENRLLWGPFGKNEKYNWTNGIFMPKHDRIMPTDIVQAFSIAGIAPKVSELRESKVILPDNCKSVVNPFSGFGAIIRKCKKEGIKVTGYDIQNVCGEDIIIQDLTDYNFVDNNYYDCLFCCPPYADKEEWTVEMPKIMSCDEWIDLCLEKFPNCKEYRFIVDESKKYRYSDDITNNSHFGKSSSKEHLIII